MQLITKIEDAIKRMKWKAIFFETDLDETEEDCHKETYGLKSTNTPNHVPEF